MSKVENSSEGSKDCSYLDERLTGLGITDRENIFHRVWQQPGSRKTDNGSIETEMYEHSRDYPLFDADEQGNIIIRYFALDGNPRRYRKAGTKYQRDFIRKRLRQPQGDMKYWQEFGSEHHPWFPPSIITKYTQHLKDPVNAPVMDVLFVIEGEFKAMKCSLIGIDAIGIPSIHGFYNGDVKGKIHEDIAELIIRCRVKKVVLLMDADALTLRWALDKDLVNRPSTFCAAVRAFVESLTPLIDSDEVELKKTYLMHLQTRFHSEAKGIDDLLMTLPAQTNAIVSDLLKLNFASNYFNGTQLQDDKDLGKKLSKYFGVVDVQEFHRTYHEFIGDNEFVFRRRRYRFNEDKNEVETVRHEDADRYARIGPDWVKLVKVLNKHGEIEMELTPWTLGEIKREYKNCPNFVDQIKTYDGFCCEPNWVNYEREVHGCYNLCEPLGWSAKAGGPIAQTVRFLKHIFQGQGSVLLDNTGALLQEEAITGDPFTVALDMLSIMLRHPKQNLPVPILVSPENTTGKTTVLKWLQIVFGNNMAILGNEQFKMRFNSHYMSKFIIAIDEGFLDVDKKTEKERLKQLVTADHAFLELKGMNIRKIPFHGKIWMCSNDADKVMKIDVGESRWFVVRVPVLAVDQRDPDIESKLKNEVEAFLHFLFNRPIHHPKSDRLWFKPEWFITEQFKAIVEATRSRAERSFEEWLKDQFLTYRQPVLRYCSKQLAELLNEPRATKYRIDALDLKALLEARGIRPGPVKRFKYPIGYNAFDERSSVEPSIIWVSSNGRAYEFRVEEWLSADEMMEFEDPSIQKSADNDTTDKTMSQL
ncbi:primase-helicase family protein [Chryseolinea sp. T2]|uniref:primase-helicase family protein n=1 Tax=Chryseolinea sp. T2 TaxID=3129255 RepID=UPI0030779264